MEAIIVITHNGRIITDATARAAMRVAGRRVRRTRFLRHPFRAEAWRAARTFARVVARWHGRQQAACWLRAARMEYRMETEICKQ